MFGVWVGVLCILKLHAVGVRRPSFVSLVLVITTNDDDGKLLLCVWHLMLMMMKPLFNGDGYNKFFSSFALRFYCPFLFVFIYFFSCYTH